MRLCDAPSGDPTRRVESIIAYRAVARRRALPDTVSADIRARRDGFPVQRTSPQTSLSVIGRHSARAERAIVDFGASEKPARHTGQGGCGAIRIILGRAESSISTRDTNAGHPRRRIRRERRLFGCVDSRPRAGQPFWLRPGARLCARPHQRTHSSAAVRASTVTSRCDATSGSP